MEKSMTKPKKIIRWTDKIITPQKKGNTPPLNRAGFWKKREPEEFKVHEQPG